MNKLYKAALLTALGLASVTGAQAATYNHDLIIGLTTTTSTTAGNDLLFDLGPVSLLSSGQSWDLNIALASAGVDINSVNLQWGVVGTTSNIGYETKTSQLQALNDYIGMNTIVATMYTLFPTAGTDQYVDASGSGIGWYSETTVSGGNASGTSFFSNFGDPNLAGLGSINMYIAPGSGADPSVAGTFSLASNGMLNFTPVPEPTSLSLMAVGAGVLFFARRNKFRRKQV